MKDYEKAIEKLLKILIVILSLDIVYKAIDIVLRFI
jgi:hypothetical protein